MVLLCYLKHIEKTVEPPVSPRKVENSVRGMIWFYVDRIDEHLHDGECCRVINQEYCKPLHIRQPQKDQDFP